MLEFIKEVYNKKHSYNEKHFYILLTNNYYVDFGTNKIPVEILKEGVFRETYLRKIYSKIIKRWYVDPWE